jgi:hypothetical protein
MPTLCRCLTGTAIETLRTHRHARAVMHSDPRRHRRLCLPVASDQRRDRSSRPLEWRSRRARRTLNPSTLAQPNPQIPISLGPDTAGSFLGDFRTPSGIRNSSRGAASPLSARPSHWRNVRFARSRAGKPTVAKPPMAAIRPRRTLAEARCSSITKSVDRSSDPSKPLRRGLRHPHLTQKLFELAFK